MQKASPEYTLLILSISSPLLLGVYRDNELIETLKSDKKISEELLEMIDGIMRRYPLSAMIYTRGPGSYMAIKLTYIILRTIEIVKKVPIKGCSAFCCNGGKPIRAIGKLYFVREGESVVTKKFEQAPSQKFSLPSSLDSVTIDRTVTPDYHIPAV